MLYVLVLPEQIIVLPLTVPGVAGMVLTVTDSACADDEPQALFAVTVTFPLEVLAVAVMELVEEVPDQSLGNVHV